MNDTGLQGFFGSLPDVAAFFAFDHLWARPFSLQKKCNFPEAVGQGFFLPTVPYHLSLPLKVCAGYGLIVHSMFTNN